MITTREIVDRLKDIYDKLAAAASFRWGVVVSTTPPLVCLDADTDPVIVGTIAPLTVGSRVLVLLQNRKNTVIGSAGGDPNLIVIDGEAYQASGTVTTPQLTFRATGALFYAYVDAYLPTPPSGYALTVSVVATSDAGVWASRSSGNHIIMAANTDSRSMTLHWQLVKL